MMQSGKTTLVRSLFVDKPYVTSEDPSERLFAEDDPKGFLAGGRLLRVFLGSALAFS